MGLDNVQRARLQSIVLNPGYEVLLDILETECKIVETELLNTKPEEHNRVIAMHTRAQAFRMLFERFQKTIKMEIHQDNPTSDELTVENYKDMLNNGRS